MRSSRQSLVTLIFSHLWPIHGLTTVEACRREADGKQDWHSRITADSSYPEKAHQIYRGCRLREEVTLWQLADALQGKPRRWLDYRIWHWMLCSGKHRRYCRLWPTLEYCHNLVLVLSILAHSCLSRLRQYLMILKRSLSASLLVSGVPTFIWSHCVLSLVCLVLGLFWLIFERDYWHRLWIIGNYFLFGRGDALYKPVEKWSLCRTRTAKLREISKTTLTSESSILTCDVFSG